MRRSYFWSLSASDQIDENGYPLPETQSVPELQFDPTENLDEDENPEDVSLYLEPEFYGPEEAGSASFLEKTITSKTKVFDVLMKIDAHEYPGDNFKFTKEVIQIADRYDPNKSQADVEVTPNDLKKEFQKNQTEIPEDQIHSQFIFAWNEFMSQMFLVNPTDLGNLSDDIDPMSDTVFPVMVMGPKYHPCAQSSLLRDMLEWEGGLYLVLDDYPAKPQHFVTVTVYTHNEHSGYTTLYNKRFNVGTYRAQLNFYRLFYKPESGSDRKYLANLGTIDRILDRRNVSLGIYGMYAGGPIPYEQTHVYGRNRLAYDLPQQVDTQQTDEDATNGILRYDIDYQLGSQRVGYFVTMDAHLVVTELSDLQLDMAKLGAKSMFDFRSLMNERTFVVCDGYNSYKLNYAQDSDRKVKDFGDAAENMAELSPRLVFVLEGISALNICLDRDHDNFRNARYFNAQSKDNPVVVNWKDFQNDFQMELSQESQESHESQERKETLEEEAVGESLATPVQQVPEPSVAGEFQQVMAERDFTDYVVLNISSFSEYCSILVLCQYKNPTFHVSKNRHYQYWHVYGLLRPNLTQPDTSLYYYLATISNSYIPIDGQMQYFKTFFSPQLFPSEIDRTKYQFITQEECDATQEIFNAWRHLNGGIIHNEEWMTFQPWLGNVRTDHIMKSGTLTTSREISLNAILGQSMSQTMAEGPSGPAEFQQVMNESELREYVVLEIPSFCPGCRTLVFCLRKKPNYQESHGKNVYWEYYHTYAQLRKSGGQSGPDLYYYCASIANRYLYRGAQLRYDKTYFDSRLFPEAIDKNKYHFITDRQMQQTERIVEAWKTIVRNMDFRRFVQDLPYMGSGSFVKAGNFTASRDQLLRQLLG